MCKDMVTWDVADLGSVEWLKLGECQGWWEIKWGKEDGARFEGRGLNRCPEIVGISYDKTHRHRNDLKFFSLGSLETGSVMPWRATQEITRVS
jgi:hypothetical protein